MYTDEEIISRITQLASKMLYDSRTLGFSDALDLATKEFEKELAKKNVIAYFQLNITYEMTEQISDRVFEQTY